MRLQQYLLVLTALALASCAGSHGTRRSATTSAPFRHVVMPVRGIQPYELSRNYGAPRQGGARKHEGLDIMAPSGREVLAFTGGVVLARKWNDLGGNTLWITGDDGRVYYYAHLSRYADEQEGNSVAAGDVIGYVGQTGDATTPHLHFEIHDTRSGPSYDPFPELTQDGILVMSLPAPTLPKKAK
jgi:murein DD-endopeptidase MepM/ murein hydrolase activator NlpD